MRKRLCGRARGSIDIVGVARCDAAQHAVVRRIQVVECVAAPVSARPAIVWGTVPVRNRATASVARWRLCGVRRKAQRSSSAYAITLFYCWRSMKPPFRAEHVGSLLRPPDLVQARQDFADGRMNSDELRLVEDEAIRDAVQMQEDIGLQRCHRRRVPARLVAHGLHVPDRRRHEGRGAAQDPLPQRGGGVEFTPLGAARDRQAATRAGRSSGTTSCS